MSHWFSSSDLPDLTGAFVDEGFLQLVELLNCGRFAKVYKALDTTSPLDDPAFYAVKCMRNAPYDSDRWHDLQNEFSLHDAVSDLPGVVSFRHTFTEAPGTDGELVFMVLDLVPHTTLHCAVSRAVYVDRPMLAKDAFFELLDVVDQCHSNGVYHCYIEPGNIFCNADGLGIRLADFGMATREDQLRAFGCGNEPYMAPECARTPDSHSARAVDLWALAMTLFNLVTGTVPWSVAALFDTRYAAFRADPAAYLRDTYHLSPAASDLFRWCFDADPAARPSVDQIRAAVLNIDQFSLACMLPRDVVVPPHAAPGLPNTDVMPSLSELLSWSRFSSTSDIGALSTPSSPGLPNTDAMPSLSELLASTCFSCTSDISALSTPSSSTSLSSSSSSSSSLASLPNAPFPRLPRSSYKPARALPFVIPPPVPRAPEFRFLDRRKHSIVTRHRFAAALQRDTRRETDLHFQMQWGARLY